MVTNEIRTEHLFVVSLVLLIPLLLVLWFQRRRTETYVLGVALLWLGITWLLAVWFLPIYLYDMGDSGGRPYLRSLHPFRYLLLYIDEYRSLDAAIEPLVKESYWFEIREILHNAISASAATALIAFGWAVMSRRAFLQRLIVPTILVLSITTLGLVKYYAGDLPGGFDGCILLFQVLALLFGIWAGKSMNQFIVWRKSRREESKT